MDEQEPENLEDGGTQIETPPMETDKPMKVEIINQPEIKKEFNPYDTVESEDYNIPAPTEEEIKSYQEDINNA